MIIKEYFELNNGVKIPKVGFGTWQIMPNDLAYEATIYALKAGYIHIDTAVAYGNEEGIGKAIKDYGIKRRDIFITSKIPAEVKNKEMAARIIDESLSRLGVDYLDLMLIHSPKPWDELWNNDSFRYEKENVLVYEALEEAYKAGKIRSIGVSNFSIYDLENIINHCEIKPMVNQIQVSIYTDANDVIAFCKKHNILVEAYSPIRTGRLLNDDKIKSIAEKYDVTIPQICIRYLLDKGLLPLPKSSHEQNIIDNTKLDFEISKEDFDYLDKLR